MKKTRDKEINAISIVGKALRPLDREARQRVFDYVTSRLAKETPVEEPNEEYDPVAAERMKTAVREAALLSPRKTPTGE